MVAPREPDRFDIDSLMRRGLSKDAAISLSRDVAAALRQAESSALERAAQICRRVASEEAPRSQVGKHAALRCEELIGYALRALIPPAAENAAETRKAEGANEDRHAEERHAAAMRTLDTIEESSRKIGERIDAQKRIAELERRVAAGLRLAKYRYRHWANSGGAEECIHGINIGICCARCDMITLETGAERVAIAAPPKEPPAP